MSPKLALCVIEESEHCSHRFVARVCHVIFLLLLTIKCGWGQTKIPETPAGHALQVWLKAFNTGDRAKMEESVKSADPIQTVDFLVNLHSQTGEVYLSSVTNKDPRLVTFRVRGRNNAREAIGSIRVKNPRGPNVSSFAIRLIPTGAVVEDVKLDGVGRHHVIEGTIANLKEYYVYPEVVQKMAAALLRHENSGDDNAETDGGAFADLLTRQLRAVSHDRHMRVIYNPFKTHEHQSTPTSEDDARHWRELERDNCAFKKIEILQGNIGYLKFNAFPDPSVCRPTVTAAMNFLTHVDALIFDLRDNHGGDPHMVTLVASYLFDHSTHLNDLYIPKSNTTQQFWTLPSVPGNKLADKPAFVLTSASTFSGGEEFSYDLKMLKRATLVGETTGGGAHPVSGHRIDDHFIVDVPSARPINPVSKTDWEGTGVEPDVKVKATDALETAVKLARAQVRQ